MGELSHPSAKTWKDGAPGGLETNVAAWKALLAVFIYGQCSWKQRLTLKKGIRWFWKRSATALVWVPW